MIVGLTGGIGSGKTTVAKIFNELGIPIYDSDAAAKRLMQTSDDVRKKIIELLGEKSYQNKVINKGFIAEQIFGNKDVLLALNHIVHPAVRKDFLAWVKLQKSPYVIQESAIIYENAHQNNYDKVILIVAPLETRIERVRVRDGVTRTQVMDRIKNQLTDMQKLDLADFVIENTAADKTKESVLAVHKQLLHLANMKS